jgi:hypothetical protein
VASVSKESRASISVETRPGNDLQDLRAEVDGELVHRRPGLVHRIASALARAEEDGVLDELAVLRHLSGLEDQGRVGGGVLRLVSGDGLEVAVSATTVVMVLSWSSLLMVPHPFRG